jgi:hypothetical protein
MLLLELPEKSSKRPTGTNDKQDLRRRLVRRQKQLWGFLAQYQKDCTVLELEPTLALRLEDDPLWYSSAWNSYTVVSVVSRA